MGCFPSCFRCHGVDKAGRTKESVKELGSLSGYVEQGVKEDMLCHPPTTSQQFTQHENPMENCQSNERIAFQEINLLDQSPKSVQTLYTKKIQLVAPCDQQNSPNQAIMPTHLGNNSVSCQNTPGTGSSEQKRACNLDPTLVKSVIGVSISDPNSLYRPVKDGEMQIPEILSSSCKGTSKAGKRVNFDLKHTQQRDIISVIESVELKNGNEVAEECHSQPNKCHTPAVMVSDHSKWLNGIPNTTTKYKEDQRVKWHATPFEERLERILSDEKMPPPRKLISGRLIQLE